MLKRLLLRSEDGFTRRLNLQIIGIPALQKKMKRFVQVNIQLTKDEDEMISKYAAPSGMTAANWIRQKAFTGWFRLYKISSVDVVVY